MELDIDGDELKACLSEFLDSIPESKKLAHVTFLDFMVFVLNYIQENS